MIKDDNDVTIVEIDRSTNKVESSSWYNKVSAEAIDKWRVFPRLLITLYGYAFYRCTEWFMTLPEPSNAQSAFVSIIVGAGAAWFGLYCGSGRSK